MRNARRIAAATAAALMIAAALTGCVVKDLVKSTVEQGIEPTSTGPHTAGPANAAQDAVDAVNAQQQQQAPQETGQ